MKRPKPVWPKDTEVPLRLQNQIDSAARRLAMLCLWADIDLSYVDKDGLSVKVDRPKPKRRRSIRT
jgi:hypothetical protein